MVYQQIVPFAGNQQKSFYDILVRIAEVLDKRAVVATRIVNGILDDIQSQSQDAPTYLYYTQVMLLRELESLDLHRYEPTSCNGHNTRSNAAKKRIHHDIRALRALFKDKPRFPQFRKLPPEIRLMIWNYAIPSRCMGSLSLDYPSPAPPIAQVCQESRAVANHHGRFVLDPGLCTTVHWFDPSKDYLIYYSDTPRCMTECARHIVLDTLPFTPSVSCSVLRQVCSPRFYPDLKTVDIISSVYRFPKSRDPILESRLFGAPLDFDHKNRVIIDIDDASAFLERIETGHSSRLVESLKAHICQEKDKKWFIDHPAGGPHTELKDWHDFQDDLRYQWVGTQYHWHPLGGGGDDVVLQSLRGMQRNGLSVDWYSDISAKCLIFRRIISVQIGSRDTPIPGSPGSPTYPDSYCVYSPYQSASPVSPYSPNYSPISPNFLDSPEPPDFPDFPDW